MRRIIYFILILSCFTNVAGAAQEPYESFFSRKQKFDQTGTELYSSNYDLKKHKRVGAAISMGGVSGAMGVHAELNLDPASTLVLGMGTGPSYGTYNFQGKFNFQADYLSPFVKVGYAKWFNSGTIPSNAGQSDVLRQVFTERELRAGKFEANFLVASVGAEYNQLEGELSGFNFYGEMTMLAETRSFSLVPTGSVGIVYFY